MLNIAEPTEDTAVSKAKIGYNYSSVSIVARRISGFYIEINVGLLGIAASIRP